MWIRRAQVIRPMKNTDPSRPICGRPTASSWPGNYGQFFQVLTRDGRVANEIGWRDTVLIEGFSTVTIATDFSNPGMWMYHCHILEHGENGMMAMVEVVENESP